MVVNLIIEICIFVHLTKIEDKKMASVYSALRAGRVLLRPVQRWSIPPVSTVLRGTHFSTGEGAAKFDNDYFDKVTLYIHGHV